jgi:hypothetical protein
MKRRSKLLFLLLMLLVAALPPQHTTAQPSDTFLRMPRLGITFISSAQHPADESRYRSALLLGAGWNRWPMYWNDIDRGSGYDWTAYDQLVEDDLQHGLRINAILLGTAPAQAEGDSIRGLHAPIFSDGTDEPGGGKTPNPNNPWASFVYAAVMRYKPGGERASQRGWQPGWGITVWEAWNEPDLTLFWRGGVESYARLLKVTYLAAHQADPGAQVMFGGLAYVNPDSDDWLADTLAVIGQDPMREAYGWFMDSVAVHNYTNARRSGWVVRRVRQRLNDYGLNRSIWLNESGVPVWDDYPGPTWTSSLPDERALRATMPQQAAFIIQSTALAWAAGADVVFYHQLYDDCGNQPSGTDFPPNNGAICTNGACWGDAHGLYRNNHDNVCFRQSPQPGTPRPAASAFYRLAQVFAGASFGSGQVVSINGRGTAVAFNRVNGSTVTERIYVLWNDTSNRIVVEVPASGTTATLFTMDNEDYTVTPTEGEYEIGVEGSSGAPYIPFGDDNSIGGAPLLMVEQVAPGAEPVDPALVHLQGMDPAPRETPSPEPLGEGATFGDFSTPIPTPRPTTDPALDTQSPTASVLPLPEVSLPTFTVEWSGQDNSGIASYLVWARENDGDWQPWLETSETQADYSGQSGSTYAFAVWAVDLAGNWSANTELTPQAVTRVE